MSDTKRKTTNASHIEVKLWFRSKADWVLFQSVKFARRSDLTVSQREWVWDSIVDDEAGFTIDFRFVHTCRNTGAHKSDATRFVLSTANASGMDFRNINVIDVVLLSRDDTVSQANLKMPPARLGIGFLTDPKYNA
jgi:hypothetical protein